MLDSILGGLQDWLGDTLTSMLEAILNATIFKLLYYAEIAVCWIIDQLYSMFEVFAGIVRVSYDGEPDYLINVFFKNGVVTNIYWAMALIGIALTFGFAIWAVVKKMFDIDGRQQQSMGQIIGAGLKSIFLIISLTLVINVVLVMTNQLMKQVNFIFNNAYHLNVAQERDFTEEEYAAMGRVLATIGNASMVPNSSNRYNVNQCFNDIRGDMLYLQQRGVFSYSYYETDRNGNEIKSWQSVLSQIARSTDLRRDVKIDIYNQGVMSSVTAAMDYLQSSGNIAPVSHVSYSYRSDGIAHLDRFVFLMGTLRAAKNSEYNQKPALTDALRGPYYYGQGRSIYNFDNVDDDFNIGFPTDYILVGFAGIASIVNLVTILLNCVARIFNMLFLYIIAPPIIAAAPLDGGGKLKQWSTAFVVQSLSVFGTVISMRLLLIFLPIVVSPQLTLFEDRPLLDVLAKFVLVYGGFETTKKATSLLTGILADSAGWQSIQAGDMSSSAGSLIGGITGAAGKVAGTALGAAKSAGGFATKSLQNLAGRAWNATGGKAAEAWTNLGKGDVQGEKAMASAKERLAAEKAYDKINPKQQGGGGSGDSGGGSTPSAAPRNNDSGGSSGGGSGSAGSGSGGGSIPSAASRGGAVGGGTGGSSGGGSGSAGSGSGGDSIPSAASRDGDSGGASPTKTPPPRPPRQSRTTDDLPGSNRPRL